MVLAVDDSGQLQSIEHARGGVLREHEPEFQVLLVRELGCVEDETPVELAHAFVNLTVLLGELKAERVALGVALRGLGDDVVDLDVLTALHYFLFVEVAGEGKFGELSNHSIFLDSLYESSFVYLF